MDAAGASMVRRAGGSDQLCTCSMSVALFRQYRRAERCEACGRDAAAGHDWWFVDRGLPMCSVECVQRFIQDLGLAGALDPGIDELVSDLTGDSEGLS